MNEANTNDLFTPQQKRDRVLDEILYTYAVNYAVSLGYDRDTVPAPPDIRDQINQLYAPQLRTETL